QVGHLDHIGRGQRALEHTIALHRQLVPELLQAGLAGDVVHHMAGSHRQHLDALGGLAEQEGVAEAAACDLAQQRLHDPHPWVAFALGVANVAVHLARQVAQKVALRHIDAGEIAQQRPARAHGAVICDHPGRAGVIGRGRAAAGQLRHAALVQLLHPGLGD
ncbi:Uncharacterized protein APZ42_002603, partial [Daphnia magna]